MLIIGIFDLLTRRQDRAGRPGLAGLLERGLPVRSPSIYFVLLLRHVAIQPSASSASSTRGHAAGAEGIDHEPARPQPHRPASDAPPVIMLDKRQQVVRRSSTCCATSSSTWREGEKIVVCGPSGSGKSTLIRCINRLEEHQEGDIVVDGIELTNDVQEHRDDPPRGRHGVPVVQPVPAPDHPREPAPWRRSGCARCRRRRPRSWR